MLMSQFSFKEKKFKSCSQVVCERCTGWVQDIVPGEFLALERQETRQWGHCLLAIAIAFLFFCAIALTNVHHCILGAPESCDILLHQCGCAPICMVVHHCVFPSTALSPGLTMGSVRLRAMCKNTLHTLCAPAHYVHTICTHSAHTMCTRSTRNMSHCVHTMCT